MHSSQMELCRRMWFPKSKRTENWSSQWRPNGSRWLPIAPNGLRWFPIAPNGSRWFPIAPNGSRWLPVKSVVIIPVGFAALGHFGRLKSQCFSASATNIFGSNAAMAKYLAPLKIIMTTRQQRYAMEKEILNPSLGYKASLGIVRGFKVYKTKKALMSQNVNG